jgi:hypothetical protein
MTLQLVVVDILAISRRTLGVKIEQSSPGDHQIR